MLLAKGSRSWRRSDDGQHIIPAFFLTDNASSVPALNSHGKAHNEGYGYHPDEGQGENGPEFHGYKKGDTRHALAPFAAHR